MSLTTNAKNTMLAALTPDAVSLHSGFPGLTGANEITGGGYARQAPTWAAPSGGIRSTSAAMNFSVNAVTVRWIGLWLSGVFQGYAPNGGTPKEFSVDPSTDVFRCPSHGWSDGQKVAPYNGTIPGGLTEGTVYFVRDSTSDTFKLAATLGGVAIDITSAGTSDCVIGSIVEDVYAGAGTHTIDSGSIGLPF